jgi:hypothetical protein
MLVGEKTSYSKQITQACKILNIARDIKKCLKVKEARGFFPVVSMIWQ